MPPAVSPYFCPLTNRIRTDERTKAFLQRVGFSLRPSKSHGLDVPVLRSAAALLRAMEGGRSPSSPPKSVAAETPTTAAAADSPRRVLVSHPFRRLLRASITSRLGTAPWSDVAALERAIVELTDTRLAHVLRLTATASSVARITEDEKAPSTSSKHRLSEKTRKDHREAAAHNGTTTPATTADVSPSESQLADRRAVEEEMAALRCDLTVDQVAALDICLTGRHVYIGGNAGTGKSFALKRIAAALTASGKRVLRTAMTGIAALQIDGTTLHNALNIAVPRRTAAASVAPAAAALEPPLLSTNASSTEPPSVDHNRVIRGFAREEYTADSIGIKGALRNIDVLLIDEVSMLDASLLTAIHDVAQRYATTGSAPHRRDQLSEQPFGGNLQVILCGDFMQLLPHSRSILSLPLFRERFTHVALTTPMRQCGNSDFVNALNALRLGEFPPCIAASATANPAVTDAVRLYPTRRSAEAYNTTMMSKLEGKAVALKSAVCIDSVVEGWSAAVTLQLCIGRRATAQHAVEAAVRRALVEDHGFAADDLGFLFSREPLGSVVTMIVRAKSWGKQLAADTLAHLQDSLEDVFRRKVAAPGVTIRCETSDAALPRSARDMMRHHAQQKIMRDALLGTKHLKIGCRVMLVRNLNDRLVNGLVGTVLRFVEPGADCAEWQRYAVHKIRRSLMSFRRMAAMPLVKFDRLSEPVVVPYVQLPIPELDASGFVDINVSTMPLVPAYAFTVHKAQGVTFDTNVVVDCAEMWPCHHLVYVAASRVKRLDQLRMVRLQKHHVTVDAECLAFSEQLPSALSVSNSLQCLSPSALSSPIA